jgi:hypothetical protein
MNQLSGSSSQSSNCAELIVRFGKFGLIVPALMFRLSASFALANALASCSVRNVSAALRGRGLPRSRFLDSNETYQVPLDLLGRGSIFIFPQPSARSDGVCHALRTLLAFIPPFRALTVSKVSRSPILMPSGSIPEAFRSLMCKNKSAQAPSTAMNPKPRSAFHVFNVPAGILFPLFQPELDHAADGGLGFRWNVRLFAAGAKHPFSANYLHQSFVSAKSSLYSISGPRLLFSIGHFAFPHR